MTNFSSGRPELESDWNSIGIHFKVYRTIHNSRVSGQNLMLLKVRPEIARKAFYFYQWIEFFLQYPGEMKDYKSVVNF